MCKVKKIWLKLKPSKMVKPKLTWLKSNLTKTRSGLTRVNLRKLGKLGKYQRIWGNICIVSKLRKFNTSIVWCPYFSLSVTQDCKNFKKTCLWARKCIEISVFRCCKRKIMKWIGCICKKWWIPRYGFLKMQKSRFLQLLSWKLS